MVENLWEPRNIVMCTNSTSVRYLFQLAFIEKRSLNFLGDFLVGAINCKVFTTLKGKDKVRTHKLDCHMIPVLLLQ